MSASCSRLMFSSCPTSALVDGVKIGSGSRSASRSPSGSAMPARPSPLRWYSAQPGAGQVAAHDALGVDPLRAPDEHRARPPARASAPAPAGRSRSALTKCERPEVGELLEPPGREAGQDGALVRDRLLEHDVEGREAVGRDEQQVALVDLVRLAHLAAVDEGQALDLGASSAVMACPRSSLLGFGVDRFGVAWSGGMSKPSLRASASMRSRSSRTTMTSTRADDRDDDTARRRRPCRRRPPTRATAAVVSPRTVPR